MTRITCFYCYMVNQLFMADMPLKCCSPIHAELIEWSVKLRFYVFSKKSQTCVFTFFELLHTFSRTLHYRYVARFVCDRWDLFLASVSPDSSRRKLARSAARWLLDLVKVRLLWVTYIYNFISPTYVVAQHKWKKEKNLANGNKQTLHGHVHGPDTDTDTDPNGPARTQRSFAAKKSVSVSVSGPCPCPCSGI